MSQSQKHTSIPTLNVVVPTDKGTTTSEKICALCNAKVIKTVLCEVCLSPYHPACAKKCPILSNGGFKKCC